jgi:hypothetical protein
MPPQLRLLQQALQGSRDGSAARPKVTKGDAGYDADCAGGALVAPNVRLPPHTGDVGHSLVLCRYAICAIQLRQSPANGGSLFIAHSLRVTSSVDRGSVAYGEEGPPTGDTLQFALASLAEVDSGAHDKVLDHSRHQDLTRCGECPDASRDMDG